MFRSSEAQGAYDRSHLRVLDRPVSVPKAHHREKILAAIGRPDPRVRPMTYAELEQSAVRGKIKARRDQVGEVPPGSLEVVDLTPVVGTKSHVQSDPRAV
jgi:hypothetical protein